MSHAPALDPATGHPGPLSGAPLVPDVRAERARRPAALGAFLAFLASLASVSWPVGVVRTLTAGAGGRLPSTAGPSGARRRLLVGSASMLAAGAARAVSGCSGGVPADGDAGDAAVPPALLQARTAPADLDPRGWLVSEKLDGVRGFWDGCVLRTRSGRRIAAPAWFLERLPAVPLDGELWMGRGRFDALSAAVRRQQPQEAEWRSIRYMVFEAPGADGPFEARVGRLHALMLGQTAPGFQVVPQRAVGDAAALRVLLEQVVAAGGEGLMLHLADAPYVTGRQPVLLKLKPEQDEEAWVIGHQPGQGRHAGRLGALRVRDAQGRVFEIGTGFTDAQRENPVPLGATVTYTYRGRTGTGLPRFASFKRVRDEP